MGSLLTIIILLNTANSMKDPCGIGVATAGDDGFGMEMFLERLTMIYFRTNKINVNCPHCFVFSLTGHMN